MNVGFELFFHVFSSPLPLCILHFMSKEINQVIKKIISRVINNENNHWLHINRKMKRRVDLNILSGTFYS